MDPNVFSPKRCSNREEQHKCFREACYLECFLPCFLPFAFKKQHYDYILYFFFFINMTIGKRLTDARPHV